MNYIHKSGEDLGGFLCFYLQAKLSHQKKQPIVDRARQLKDIIRDCNTTWRTANPIERGIDVDKHVILYTHNGFGNQLYQTAFAYMLSQSLGRQLHIADETPQYLYNKLSNGHQDPNSYEGNQAGKHFSSFHRVMEDWTTLNCQGSNITFTDRKSDKRSWSAYRKIVDVAGWRQFFEPVHGDKFAKNPKNQAHTPKCLFMIGYWLNSQWFNPFLPQLRLLFKEKFTKLPRYNLDKNSFVIHLRCAEPHYMTPPKSYYDAILNRTTYSDIWLAASPSCKTKGKRVYRYLIDHYKAKLYPLDSSVEQTFQGPVSFMKDFALLASAHRLILCPSTFSDWGALLSNAREIHTIHLREPKGYTVSRNWSPLWADERYIYHDPYTGYFYGHYSTAAATGVNFRTE